ncbi:hypothetical protein HYH02_008396 [Chlamydomonas schloesseri]|uniref:Presenilin n=1 Tax=Chlamydomonas schloesseri TaxID=2026947 RepID=A0A835WGP7_9CHLO|nr:hypothetical protein HYH02_008396 [Chlamydomonas schloesseri]|eukprot:KAG2446836.1 hypothetical protein HYH02_008396 [Chlamydomonas schloesseri]
MATPSLLDDLGEEVTGIVAPVSLCMAVTVLLVRLLNPEGISSSNTVLIASIAYQEQASDSSSKKFGGALLNALIFVAVVAGMTVVLFLLFKYKCYKFIFAYMGFAVFNIFFFITGALFIQVMQVIDLHIDAFSLAYGLFNFSVIGTLGLLFMPIPLLSKQVYLIWVGIIVAYIFTFIPEWTAWVIICFMALYDIVAVLVPGGPLKALVELAIERQQELPALIYEARPAGGRPYVRGWGNRGQHGEGDDGGGGPDGPGSGPGGAGGPYGDMDANGGGRGGGEAVLAAPPNMVPSPHTNGPRDSRPVAEGASPVGGNLEMRQPTTRTMQVQDQAAGAGAVLGPYEAPGSPGGSGRRRAAAMSGGGGGGGGGWVQSRVASTVGGADAETQVQSMGLSTASAADAAMEEQWQQQPQRLRQRSHSGGGGGSGPRPVAEGKEQGEWQQLPAAPEAGTVRVRPGAGAGGSSLHEPLGAADSGRSSPRSHTSMEPLLNQRTAAAALERDLQGFDGGARPSSSRGHNGSSAGQPPQGREMRNLAPGAGAAAASAGKGKVALDPFLRRPSSGLAAGGPLSAAGAGGNNPPQLVSPGTMVVRAVAPAFDAERLAEAVRRNTLDGDLLASAPPPQLAGPPPPDGHHPHHRGHGHPNHGPDGGPPDDGLPDLPDSIKLGLGDFIFYSMLVGRAAMYDFMTVFAAYLAIIAGLGLTLLCLAVFQKALPALPFSIALGVAFYFLTRLTLEPFIVPMVTNLAFF